MEAGTIEKNTDTEAAQPPVETSPAEHRSPDKLFKFSEYVHVGPGAEECEGGKDGSCANPEHFHAWARLPNQFQHASIREKAMAAKARRGRQFRDPDTDGYAVLEGELDMLRRAGDSDKLIEEIVSQHFFKDHSEAVSEIGEREEFKTITEDLERYRVLVQTPEAERPADEYTELENHINDYQSALETERAEQQRPRKEALASVDIDALIDQVRDIRIEAESNEEFMRAYALWEQRICTLKPRPKEEGLPKEAIYYDVNQLTDEAPEVIDALNTVYTELRAAMQHSSAGNS